MMNTLIIIGLVTIVIASLALINDTIDNQQELSEINSMVQQKNIEIATETISIQAVNLGNSIEFTNHGNEEIKIIQIRVYDDDGNYVESFDVDEIISGNTELEITDLPIILQEMLIQ